MYHDVKHENGCIGLDLINPEMRDCTCGKIIECLLAEREHLQKVLGDTARREASANARAKRLEDRLRNIAQHDADTREGEDQPHVRMATLAERALKH